MTLICVYPEAECEDQVCKILVRFEQTLLLRIPRIVTVDSSRLSCLHKNYSFKSKNMCETSI